MAGKWLGRHGVTVACAAAAAAAVAGIASAAIPGADGTIAGCYAKAMGNCA